MISDLTQLQLPPPLPAFHEYQQEMAQDPKSLPQSFNPFDTHPFTNGSGLVSRPALPPTYPAPIPSAHLPTYYTGAMMPEGLALSNSYESMSSISSSESNASSLNTTPLHSPNPSRAPLAPPPTASARPIFERFRKDASTPELVLKKRPPILVPANGMMRAK